MTSPFNFGRKRKDTVSRRARRPRPELRNRAVTLNPPPVTVLEHMRGAYAYNPATGALTHASGSKEGQQAWVIEANRPVVWVGLYAGTCRRYAARCVCWLLLHGRWPDHNVRAVDPAAPFDLRPENLRLVTGRGDNKLARRAG